MRLPFRRSCIRASLPLSWLGYVAGAGRRGGMIGPCRRRMLGDLAHITGRQPGGTLKERWREYSLQNPRKEL